MPGKQLERILLIEDDPDIQQVAQIALEGVGGFEVHICDGGREALEAVSEIAPDLILLDVMMPGMDGPTTLRALRELPAAAETPVAFMTAKILENEKAQFLALGAVEVIAKPFDPMALSAIVQRIWDQHWENVPENG